LLEKREGNGVPFLVLPERRLIQNLEAVVGQMHNWVVRVDVIFATCSPQIPFVEKVNVELIWYVLDVNQAPHPDVKLSLFVE